MCPAVELARSRRPPKCFRCTSSSGHIAGSPPSLGPRPSSTRGCARLSRVRLLDEDEIFFDFMTTSGTAAAGRACAAAHFMRTCARAHMRAVRRAPFRRVLLLLALSIPTVTVPDSPRAQVDLVAAADERGRSIFSSANDGGSGDDAGCQAPTAYTKFREDNIPQSRDALARSKIRSAGHLKLMSLRGRRRRPSTDHFGFDSRSSRTRGASGGGARSVLRRGQGGVGQGAGRFSTLRRCFL